ncbi:MAG: hypothetical protein MUF18_19045 [Fimbriiglobus sp.]|jgi:hypothetical protein|nr:hypothetical protein [Fimbriiglobus sp.]
MSDQPNIPPPPGISPSDHARLRSTQGRPIGQVVNDAQRAGPNDVFVQPEDGRFVVRGQSAREHVIEPDGEHVTSIQPRTDSAHRKRLRDGTIRPATPEEFARFKSFVG